MRQFQSFEAALKGYVKYGLHYAPDHLTLLSPNPDNGLYYLDQRKHLHIPTIDVGGSNCIIVADLNPAQLQALSLFPVPDLFRQVDHG